MTRTLEYNIKTNTGQTLKSLGDVENKLEEINKELKGTEVGSKRFKELSKKAQILNRDLEKINNEVEGFTADKKFQAADGAIKLAAGSLQTFVGGLGLLGVENEALVEFEQKAASAIAVGLGLKDISEGVGQLGPLFKQSGIAAKLFGSTTNKALIATGIGAFVVVIGTVVAYWDDIVKGVTKFAEKVPFVGKAIETVKEAFNSLIERFRPVLEFFGILPDAAEIANKKVIESNNEVIQGLEREIAILQAKGATEEELYNKRRQLAEAELDNLRREGAEKEEIYKKETELLAMIAKEEQRLSDVRAEAELRRQLQLQNKKVEVEEERGITDIKVGLQKQELDWEYLAAKVRGDNTKAKLDADQAQIESEIAKQMALGASANALSALGGLLKEESAGAKQLAISSAIINTYLGVTQALKADAAPFVEPFATITRIANATAILATGLGAVKNIKSTPTDGGGGTGGGFRPTPARRTTTQVPQSPTAQTPSLQDLNAAGEINQRQQGTPLVEAYVLEGSVTNSQEAASKLRQRRRIGA